MTFLQLNERTRDDDDGSKDVGCGSEGSSFGSSGVVGGDCVVDGDGVGDIGIGVGGGGNGVGVGVGDCGGGSGGSGGGGDFRRGSKAAGTTIERRSAGLTSISGRWPPWTEVRTCRSRTCRWSAAGEWT